MFVLGGGVVGIAAVGLALAADWVGAVFEAFARHMPLAVLVLTPLGFAASSWLSRRFFPNPGGSGILQVIAAWHLHGLAARERLVSLRVTAGKMVVLLVGLLSGAPAQALVVLGMVAYFSGVVQAPITAFVIVTEMTKGHALTHNFVAAEARNQEGTARR